MRTRTAVLLAPLLALSLLAACSGDDDDDDATPNDDDTTEETAADGDDEQADVGVIVERAQLEVEDLGEGWELTSTTPAGEDDDEPNPIDDCAGDVQERFDAATVAESEERSFTQTSEDGAVLTTNLSSSAVALDDPSLFDEMHELIRSDEFAECFREAFVEASGAGPDLTVGEIQVGDGVDPDAAPEGLTSTSLVIPVTFEAEGIPPQESLFSITLLHLGEVGASVLLFGDAANPVAELGAELSGIVADRLAG